MSAKGMVFALNAIKKDLNFFTAYKKGSHKAGRGSNAAIVVLIVCFLLAVGITFGVITLLETRVKQQTNEIRKELSGPKSVELQQRITFEGRKNSLLSAYRNALDLAKKAYDSTKIIDSSLLAEVSRSVPEDVKVISMAIDTQSVQMECISMSSTSPAIFTQSLRKNPFFSSVTYDGYSFLAEEGYYIFHINGYFQAEVTHE